MAFECMHKGKPVTRKAHKAVLPPAEENKPSMFGLFVGNISTNPVQAVQDPDPHPPAGEFAGLLHVTVHKIDDFSHTAGFMDRTDPYVLLRLGSDEQTTSCKENVSPFKKSRVWLVCCAVAGR